MDLMELMNMKKIISKQLAAADMFCEFGLNILYTIW